MRTTLIALVCSGLFGLLLLPACGGGGDSGEKGVFDKIGEAAKTMKNAAKGLSEVSKDFEDIDKMTPVPPVRFDKLIPYLPTDAFGLKRGDPEGNTQKMDKFQYSQASVEFTDPDPNQNRDVQVSIFDYAYIPMLYAPFKMALSMQISNESTSGYERSTTILGFPAYEKWDKDSQEEDVTVMVGKRFIVEVKAENLKPGQARQLAEAMSLLDLADEGKAPS